MLRGATLALGGAVGLLGFALVDLGAIEPLIVVAVSMLTRTRGSSNARAKRELGWELRWPSWRQGFRRGLATG